MATGMWFVGAGPVAVQVQFLGVSIVHIFVPDPDHVGYLTG